MNQLFKNTFVGLLPLRSGDAGGIEISYDNAEAIPAGYEGLYSEKDGKFVLTGVKGLKTQEDVNKLQTALAKERNDHKATKSVYASLASHGSVEDIVAQLDRIPELEASGGKGSPEDIEKIVTARLKPLERQLEQANGTIKTLQEENTGYKKEKVINTVRAEVTKAAQELKIRASAIEDAVMYGERVLELDDNGNVVTRDGVGVTPFITAKDWLTEMLPKRSHWLEDSHGGGSQGGSAGFNYEQNPYSPEAWSVTAQMKLYKENPTKAASMAKRFNVDPLNPKKPVKKS